MNKDEFMQEVREGAKDGDVAEFIWNRWLRLYAYSIPKNPGKAWGQQW